MLPVNIVWCIVTLIGNSELLNRRRRQSCVMSGVCGLDEGISVLLRQVPRVPECSGTLKEGLMCIRHSITPEPGHMILWLTIRYRGCGGMVGVKLEGPCSAMIGRAVRIRFTVVG